MKVFRRNEQDVQVTVRPRDGGWIVSLDGEELPWPVRRDSQGAWFVDTPEGRRRFWAHARQDGCLVFGDGRSHRFELPDPGHEHEEGDAGAGPRLVVDMPGKVVKVLVAAGDDVAVGQPLVIMESMKMETELAAAVAGTVRAVHAAAGQVVGQGDLLLEIEPREEE
ncbi:MAG: acetyl-CoA carboxylase biotin carboxyl carrier protein subunit [Candidatus Krumholzibacteriia bacterium]